MSGSRMVLRLRRRLRRSSAIRVECPIVQTREAGIYQFSFNRRAWKESARGLEIHIELLLMIRHRFTGLQFEQDNAAVRALYETIERATKNRLSIGLANRERDFKQRVARFERHGQSRLGAQGTIGLAGALQQPVQILDLGKFLNLHEALELLGDAAAVFGSEAHACAVDKPMHQGAAGA